MGITMGIWNQTRGSHRSTWPPRSMLANRPAAREIRQVLRYPVHAFPRNQGATFRQAVQRVLPRGGRQGAPIGLAKEIPFGRAVRLQGETGLPGAPVPGRQPGFVTIVIFQCKKDPFGGAGAPARGGGCAPSPLPARRTPRCQPPVCGSSSRTTPPKVRQAPRWPSGARFDKCCLQAMASPHLARVDRPGNKQASTAKNPQAPPKHSANQEHPETPPTQGSFPPPASRLLCRHQTQKTKIHLLIYI